MIHNVVNEIKAGIGKHFPGNFFLVNQNGLLVEVDDNMLKLSGVSDFNEIKGTHVRRFGEEAWKTTLEVIKTRKRVELYEKKDGRTYYVMKIPYTKGSFRGVLGFSIDITKLKQAEQAKYEFLMNMSHDLRTPFTGVYAIAERAYSETHDEKIKEDLGYIITSSKQWMAVIDNIFELLNSESIEDKSSYFPIHDLIDEIRLLYISAIQAKNIALHVVCGNYLIWMQRLCLKQILISLVSNAVKFTTEGSVTISAHVINDLLTIRIKDTGIGIAKDKQDYVFEKFTKIRSSGQSGDFVGTGLGLYITKQCIEKLNGKIELISELGQGSSFQVEIPLKNNPQMQ